MERRNFLKILPLAAVAPVVVKEGVVSMELPGPGHYVIICNEEVVDARELAEYPEGLLPKGSSGGWIISVRGNPENAIKFFKLDERNS
jgi:hypothetical protein